MEGETDIVAGDVVDRFFDITGTKSITSKAFLAHQRFCCTAQIKGNGKWSDYIRNGKNTVIECLQDKTEAMTHLGTTTSSRFDFPDIFTKCLATGSVEGCDHVFKKRSLSKNKTAIYS